MELFSEILWIVLPVGLILWGAYELLTDLICENCVLEMQIQLEAQIIRDLRKNRTY